MIDFSDIKDEMYGKQVLFILELHEKMCSGHLGEINVLAHRIKLKPGTRPPRQHPYSAGTLRRELIEENVNKMLAAKDIELVQSNWETPIVIEPKKDGTTLFCVDYRKLNEVTVPDSY